MGRQARGTGVRAAKLVAVGLLMLAVAGCASAGTSGSSSPIDAVTSAATGTSSSSHKVTFPALYFDLSGTSADPEQALEDAGYSDIQAADDGSYTATVPADAYESLVSATKDMVSGLIEGIPQDRRYPDAVAVDSDEQFATVTVTFSTSELTPEESLVSSYIGNAVCMYQTVASLPVGCDVILVGPDGAELAETDYPQAASSSAEKSAA